MVFHSATRFRPFFPSVIRSVKLRTSPPRHPEPRAIGERVEARRATALGGRISRGHCRNVTFIWKVIAHHIVDPTALRLVVLLRIHCAKLRLRAPIKRASCRFCLASAHSAQDDTEEALFTLIRRGALCASASNRTEQHKHSASSRVSHRTSLRASSPRVILSEAELSACRKREACRAGSRGAL